MTYTTKTNGIVIRSYDYGDGHRIVVIYTEALGKLKVVARSSRKTGSRHAALLEPFTVNECMLYRKPDQEIFTLTGLSVLDDHRKLREDMDVYFRVSTALETLDLLSHDEDADPGLYDLTVEYLESVEAALSDTSLLWLYAFRLLKFTGYRLEMFKCVACGDQNLASAKFSVDLGGMVCRSCSNAEQQLFSVSKITLKSIRNLGKSCGLTENQEKEIANIILKFIKYNFGKDVRSARFIGDKKIGKGEKFCISRN